MINDELDPEVVALVEAMNLFEGITTFESCCGHGKKEFCIWFQVDNLEVLSPLLYWFSSCHSGVYGWDVVVDTDCGMGPVSFMAHSTSKGPKAYLEAAKIAAAMRKER